MHKHCVLVLCLMVAIVLMGGCGEEPQATEANGADTQSPDFTALERAAKEQPENIEAQLALAEAYYDDGKYNDAYIAFRNAVRINSDNFAAIMGLASTNQKLKNTAEGLDWIRRARRLDPKNVEAAELEGRLLLMAGQPDRAIKALKEAIAIDDTYAPAWLNLSAAYSMTMQNDEAIAAAKKAGELDAGLVASHFLLGRQHERMGHYQQAETAYRKVIELNNKNVHALIGLARVLVAQQKELDEARNLAMTAARLRSDNAEARILAAWASHLRGENEIAARELVDIANSNPQNPEVWHKLAFVLDELGDVLQAERARKNAERFVPKQRRSDLADISDEEFIQ